MSASSSSSRSFAILGAGITGLTAAYRLTRLGHNVRVFESAARVGGAIATERDGGWLVESGPNSLLADAGLLQLIDELGLAGQRIPANPAARKRFIVCRGRPAPVPMSPAALLRTPLLSFGGTLRLFGDVFLRPRVRTVDVSLADFIEAHFGTQVVDYALNPIVSGIYAGNPIKLSTRHAFPKLWQAERTHGSVLRGLLAGAKERKRQSLPKPQLISFRDGLQTLPHALAAQLPADALCLNCRVEALVPGSRWSVIAHGPQGAHTEEFDGVISALPAPALAQLRLGALGERPLALLDGIEHPPVSSLFLGFHREQVAHPLDGFGVLAPEIEKRSLLGVLFSSTLFPARAPDGHVALTVLIGGTRQPEIARRPPEEILAAIEPDLRQLLGVRGAPVFFRHHVWPKAIPQYNLGYERYLEAFTACENTFPGFLLGGQARDGISVPACVAAGEKLAARCTALPSR
ncbi:protoporphyrinogen oxidase [Horticoccus luteus]|uniref:Coproporphyrinogen III oxidase n=1 Tax=Horticoccus luteus TaxID=2862869 RepID=A0A8F9TVW1_9BACT|nr:protoporphyrinogen oxidase [Horticoccus luteus]QYM80204.1 protoporphyrinogen oxidase [Horticoccus luteus]